MRKAVFHAICLFWGLWLGFLFLLYVISGRSAMFGVTFFACIFFTAIFYKRIRNFFYMDTEKKVTKKKIKESKPEAPAPAPAPEALTDLISCVKALEKYLTTNKSTDWFRAKLSVILLLTNDVIKQFDSYFLSLGQKFDTQEISYTRYSNPALALRNQIVKSINGVHTHMLAFNEEKYLHAIQTKPKGSQRDQYLDLYEYHQRLVEECCTLLENSGLMLDRLITEMSKRSKDGDSDWAKQMDDLLSEIKHYE